MQTVAQLIEILQKLPPDVSVEVFHLQYCGGGDEETFSDVEVFVTENFGVILTPDLYRTSLEHVVGPVFTTEELLASKE